MKNFRKISLVGLLGMAVAGAAYAVTQGFTVSIRFLEPLSFNTAVNPDMGDWLAGPTARDLQLLTTGAVAGTDSGDYIGGATVGSVNVVGSAGATIDIVANNFVANGNVTIDNIPCKYGPAAATTCGGAGIVGAAAPTLAGTALLLGVDVVTSALHTDGQTASPTFDVVVTYN